MRRERMRGWVEGLGLTVVLIASLAWAQAPATPAPGKLTRLVVAVAPLGWDTNFTWLQSRSGMLDKRPALEYLVGIDRHTGGYIPELAEKWDHGAGWQKLDPPPAPGRPVSRAVGALYGQGCPPLDLSHRPARVHRRPMPGSGAR